MKLSKRAWALAVALATQLQTQGAEGPRLRVETGGFDRPWTLVRFEAKPGLPAIGAFTTGEGAAVPYQTRDGVGVMILENLKAGQTLTLTPTPAKPSPAHESLAAKTQGEICELRTAEGRPVLRYQIGEAPFPRPGIDPAFLRGGHIHPVFSPSGLKITDDYPSNHIHHHGIWFAWTKTEFAGRAPDFWNMGQKKGKVEPDGGFASWEGPVAAGFEARHRFVDLLGGKPTTALRERWRVEVFRPPATGAPIHIFELTSTHECASSEPLILPEYFYGGLGVRGNWAWNGADKTQFLTSGGEGDRVKANATRGNWCHIGGLVDGKRTGMAMLGHPDNFRAPQPMRVHPTEPFFCFAPSQLGDWRIEPGKPHVSRYLFVARDGPPDPALLDQLWKSYAKPPSATWVE